MGPIRGDYVNYDLGDHGVADDGSGSDRGVLARATSRPISSRPDSDAGGPGRDKRAAPHRLRRERHDAGLRQRVPTRQPAKRAPRRAASGGPRSVRRARATSAVARRRYAASPRPPSARIPAGRGAPTPRRLVPTSRPLEDGTDCGGACSTTTRPMSCSTARRPPARWCDTELSPRGGHHGAKRSMTAAACWATWSGARRQTSSSCR